MKTKRIKLLGLLFCFTAMVTMMSCSDKQKEEFSLVGKTFASVHYFDAWGPYDSYAGYDVIRFVSSSTIECSYRENGIHGPLLAESQIVNGTYTLAYPNMHLEYDDPVFPSIHNSIDVVFIGEDCFRISSTGEEYVLQ